MTERQGRTLSALTAAANFARQHIGRSPALERMSRDLDKCLASIKALGREQKDAVYGRGSSASRVSVLRKWLRTRHMLRISRRAKTVVKGLPDTDPLMWVPHATAKSEELI